MSLMFIDVTDATFHAEVIERSRSMPVVVDFWADWCGPALAVSPRLEDAVYKREGRVLLAKLNIDQNPLTAKGYNIYSLPTMKAFRDAVEVSELQGVQPEEALDAWIGGLITGPTDVLIEAGDEGSLRQAAELDPNLPDAVLPLARAHYAKGETDEALKLLYGMQGSFVADGLAARIELERSGEPDVGAAFAALDAGELEAGLEVLIDAAWMAEQGREELRRVVVGVIDELASDDPRAREYRRKLAAALY